MIGSLNARRVMLAAPCAVAMLLLPCIRPASAQTIIDSWKSVAVPPPPQVQPVTVDSTHTALLILDMYETNCIESQRPRCVPTIPRVQRLLAEARAHKMMVAYTGSPPSSANPGKPLGALAPLPNEPTARGPADKFLGSDLEKTLVAGNIHTVILVGTSADGAVLYTASGAALRNMTAIVAVDGISSINPFAELYTVWHLKNTSATVSKNVILTKTDMITMH